MRMKGKEYEIYLSLAICSLPIRCVSLHSVNVQKNWCLDAFVVCLRTKWCVTSYLDFRSIDKFFEFSCSVLWWGEYWSTHLIGGTIKCSLQFLGTAILMIAIFAFTDKKNGPPPPGLVPLAIFFLMLCLGQGLGLNTGLSEKLAHLWRNWPTSSLCDKPCKRSRPENDDCYLLRKGSL